MVALHRVEDVDGRAVVLRDAEADRIGPFAGGKMRAASARVAEIAAVGDGLLIGLPDLVSVGAAAAFVEIPETAARQREPIARVEIGTGHGRYRSIFASPSIVEVTKT